jgi:hypothetical protein
VDDVCRRIMVVNNDIEWFVEVVEYSVAVNFYCIILIGSDSVIIEEWCLIIECCACGRPPKVAVHIVTSRSFRRG